MRQVSKEINLADASISSLIAKFAFPAILANLVGSIYNIADQIFIGQKMGTVGNAATNIAFPLVLLMTMFSTMLGSGGASKFSLYQGAGENKKSWENCWKQFGCTGYFRSRSNGGHASFFTSAYETVWRKR